jgi:hypothetical protein
MAHEDAVVSKTKTVKRRKTPQTLLVTVELKPKPSLAQVQLLV